VRPFYSLWDTDTGNSLGTYETEDEALAVVHGLLLVNNPDFAEALGLGCHHRLGSERPVAAGAELARLAGAEVSSDHVPAEPAELAT